MNNFEYIKSMNIDEIVHLLYKITDCDECPADTKYCCFGESKCKKCIKQWLENEVENEQNRKTVF